LKFSHVNGMGKTNAQTELETIRIRVLSDS